MLVCSVFHLFHIRLYSYNHNVLVYVQTLLLATDEQTTYTELRKVH
jgi:hypothetical protein